MKYYYATVEKMTGEIETINGVISYETSGAFLRLKGEDFDIYLSSQQYAVINIQEGEL